MGLVSRGFEFTQMKAVEERVLLYLRHVGRVPVEGLAYGLAVHEHLRASKETL